MARVTSERNREYLFLRLYLRGITYINAGPHSEEELRLAVSFFVEEVPLLEGAVSQASAAHYRLLKKTGIG